MDADHDYWFDVAFHLVVKQTVLRELIEQQVIRDLIIRQEQDKLWEFSNC